MNTNKTIRIIALFAAIAVFVISACACSVRRIDSDETEKPASEVTAGNSADADSESDRATENGTESALTPDTQSDNTTESKNDETIPKETDAPETTKSAAEDTSNKNAEDTTTAVTTQSGAGRQVEPLPSNADDTFARTVFVGDSICSGFRVYGVMPANNCLAVGNVGARSIFDYTFAVNGVEYDLITAIKLVDPAFVVFSMGMNDINITSAEQYCANYDNILSQVHAAVPNAKLFVASITPTYNAPSFTNSRIDSFNAAISAHLAGTGYYYIDVNSVLKDSATNSLVSTYHSGDGIHLSPAAYEIFKSTVYSYFKSIGVAS